MVWVSYDLQDQVKVYMDPLQEVSRGLSEFYFLFSPWDQSESSSFLLKLNLRAVQGRWVVKTRVHSPVAWWGSEARLGKFTPMSVRDSLSG